MSNKAFRSGTNMSRKTLPPLNRQKQGVAVSFVMVGTGKKISCHEEAIAIVNW
jgi:hypothetical protein